MDPQIASIEPKLKEILYRCLEEIKATKAALYLMGEPENLYMLVTQYGPRTLWRREIPPKDDVIERLVVKRSPFFVNSLTEDPRFSELLFNSDSTRMLVTPIYSRGKLVGLIDMRDKAGKVQFTSSDLQQAHKITEQFLEVFTENGLYGQRKVALVQPPQTPAARPAVADNQAAPAIDTPASTALLIEKSKRAVSSGLLRSRSGTETLNEAQVAAAGLILPSILSLPGVVMAAFSSFGKLGGYQAVVATARVTEEALEQFQAKLRAWLQKREEPERLTRTMITYPHGTAGTPIEPHRLISMLSAPVQARSLKGLVLTAAFEMPPSPHTKNELTTFLRQIQQMADYSIAHERLQSLNQRIAERLLEPDFQNFPALVAHSRRVADLAERFGNHLGLDSAEIETLRVAGLVHDVGMRLLDYRNLYRKTTPTAEELKILREHPVVSAAIVAQSPLGSDVANVVLLHHERVDGTGYPNGLRGEAIPLASRILHICEAYDAMTATDSYQAALPPASALAKIKRAGGTQFDETLAAKFSEMLVSSPA